MKRAILLVAILFLALLAIVMAMSLRREAPPILITAVHYTSTPSSRPTAIPTPMAPSLDLPGCVLWYELRNQLVGEDVCVVGHIKVMVRDDPGSEVVRIYLEPTLSRGDQRRMGAPKDFYFFDGAFSHTDLRMGDCISASGTLSINEHGGLFMRLDNNLQKCP